MFRGTSSLKNWQFITHILYIKNKKRNDQCNCTPKIKIDGLAKGKNSKFIGKFLSISDVQ